MRNHAWVETPMTRISLLLAFAMAAGPAIATPCTGNPADGSYRCQDSLLSGTISLPLVTTFETPKSGVTRPTVVSEDYRRGICDLSRIIYPQSSIAMLSVSYDDGFLSFDCGQDLEYPK